MKPIDAILQGIEEEIALLESENDRLGVDTRVMHRLQAMYDLKTFIHAPTKEQLSVIVPKKLDPIVRCRVIFRDGQTLEFSQPRALCQRQTIWVTRDDIRTLCQIQKISPDGQTFHFTEVDEYTSRAGAGKNPGPTNKSKSQKVLRRKAK